MIILDHDDIERLARKRRASRLGKRVPPRQAERELEQELKLMWSRVIEPADRRLRQLIEAGAGPGEIADLIDATLRRAQLDYGMQADQISYRWQKSVDKLTRIRMKSALARSFGIDVKALMDSPNVADALRLGGREAADLITSIPKEHLGKVAEACNKAFRGIPLPEGRSLLSEILEIGHVTKKRARLIARDQTNKLSGALDRERQRSIGVSLYIWRTVKDQRVAGSPWVPRRNDKHHDHYVMEGLTCRWDDQSIYSRNGGKTWLKREARMPKVFPGWEINCRCYSEAVIDLKEVIKYAKAS